MEKMEKFKQEVKSISYAVFTGLFTSIMILIVTNNLVVMYEVGLLGGLISYCYFDIIEKLKIINARIK